MLFKGRVSLFLNFCFLSWVLVPTKPKYGSIARSDVRLRHWYQEKGITSYYWHRNQSVAEAAVWFQWGYLLVYCLFEFQLSVLFTEFSNSLCGAESKNISTANVTPGPEWTTYSTLLSRSISALFFAVLRNFWCHPSIPNTMLVVEGAAGP